MKLQKLFCQIVILFSLFIISCAPASYIGDKLAPTDHIDVFYASKDVKKEYKVIGHITVISELNENKTKTLLIKKARSVGADGIIILGLDYTGAKSEIPYGRADAIKYLP